VLNVAVNELRNEFYAYLNLKIIRIATEVPLSVLLCERDLNVIPPQLVRDEGNAKNLPE